MLGNPHRDAIVYSGRAAIWVIALFPRVQDGGVIREESGLFTLVSAVGFVRLRDFFLRMHPPALAYTFASWCVALANTLYFSMLEARPMYTASVRPESDGNLAATLARAQRGISSPAARATPAP